MDNIHILDRINQQYDILAQQEKKIARYIQNNIAEIPSMSITELSKATQTSNSTVTRLCQKLDYENFVVMKNTIARGMKKPSASSDINTQLVTYYSELLDASSELIEEKKVQELAQIILQSKKIILFGLGSSYLSACEFKSRLERMGLRIDVFSDHHTMLMISSLLGKDDLVIAVSSLGKTQSLIEACSVAKDNGAKIWAITSRNHTELTKVADDRIFTSNISTITDPKFINSQLAIMFTLDIISYVLLEQKELFDNRQKTLDILPTTD